MKAFYCLIIYLSIHLCGYAILPTQFHFRHYNIENGVSSNCITSIIQDQKGYIWMGTENGLSRFDGTQFSFYRKTDPSYPNFNSSFINTICEANASELWLGTEHGIYIYNQVQNKFIKFTQTTSNNTSISSWISHIIQDKEKNMWTATRKQGIFLYNTQTKKLVQYEVPCNDNNVVYIISFPLKWDELNN